MEAMGTTPACDTCEPSGGAKIHEFSIESSHTRVSAMSLSSNVCRNSRNVRSSSVDRPSRLNAAADSWTRDRRNASSTWSLGISFPSPILFTAGKTATHRPIPKQSGAAGRAQTAMPQAMASVIPTQIIIQTGGPVPGR